MKENSLEEKQNCEIEEPSVKYKESFLSALKEYHEEKRNLDKDEKEIGDDFTKFIQHLKDVSQGINMKPGWVPENTYWIVDKDGYAGRVSLRHELTDKLLNFGGHIGYEVRPSKRGHGYGTKALELVLPKARALGLKRVLITCHSTNIGSRKIIEANGGVLENEIPGEDGGPSRLRFWIEL